MLDAFERPRFESRRNRETAQCVSHRRVAIDDIDHSFGRHVSPAFASLPLRQHDSDAERKQLSDLSRIEGHRRRMRGMHVRRQRRLHLCAARRPMHRRRPTAMPSRRGDHFAFLMSSARECGCDASRDARTTAPPADIFAGYCSTDAATTVLRSMGCGAAGAGYHDSGGTTCGAGGSAS